MHYVLGDAWVKEKERRDYVLQVGIYTEENKISHTVTMEETTYSKHYEQEEACLQSGSTNNDDDRITVRGGVAYYQNKPGQSQTARRRT